MNSPVSISQFAGEVSLLAWLLLLRVYWCWAVRHLTDAPASTGKVTPVM